MIENWLKDIEGKVLMAGYGSLLSSYSRKTYSDIHSAALPATIHAWQRRWITRGFHEKQTFAGAIPSANSKLSAQLVPMNFDPEFELRERDYRFTRLRSEQIQLNGLSSKQEDLCRQAIEKSEIYICETLAEHPSTEEYPVYLSYVLTCLAGSYETGDLRQVERFIDLSYGWNETVIENDLQRHCYPRSTKLNDALETKLLNYFLSKVQHK